MLLIKNVTAWDVESYRFYKYFRTHSLHKNNPSFEDTWSKL